MEEQFDLTDEQCDRLVALTMSKLATIHDSPYGAMNPADLNPNINEHHALRRSIVRTAYELGKMMARKSPDAP